jgi:hypothetical protein
MRMFLPAFLLFFISLSVYSSELSNKENITINFQYASYNLKYKSNNLLYNELFENYSDTNSEKSPIFDKPDYSWFQEKNRLEKLFIAIGSITFAIGFGMFLAGIINLFVPFDAVSSDGQYIPSVRNAYIAVTSIGGSLMAIGIPFIIVGSVRLGLDYKKSKEQNNNK